MSSNSLIGDTYSALTSLVRTGHPSTNPHAILVCTYLLDVVAEHRVVVAEAMVVSGAVELAPGVPTGQE